MFRKIFCPVDLSENSVKALHWTEFLAKKHNSEVVILHVIESLQANPVIDLDYPRIQSAAMSALQEFVSPLNVKYETMLSSGHPAHKIVSLAEAVEADLIVMGTRGLRGVSHAFMGSTTERVVRASSLPVLTVTPECSMPPDGNLNEHVLVPISTLQHVPRGYLRLRRVLKQLHALPTLMHVVRGADMPVSTGYETAAATQIASYEYTGMKQNLLKIGGRISNDSADVEAVVRFGGVADELLKELKTGNFSFLLMAVRKKGILPTFIESIGYHLLSLAPVPVITVKKGE